MPKRKAEYLDQKRNQILDAAFAVCMRKPMHEVSMRDIITETGFSQGNIYRYYPNIDAIIIELIDQRRIDYDVKISVDSAVLSELAPEKVIGELFKIWEKAFLDSILGVGKIYHEICTVYVNNLERLDNFISKCSLAADEAYWKEKSIAFTMQKVSDGYFKPKLPVEDIISFLATSFDGITRDLIISENYTTPAFAKLDKGKLIHSLYTAFILLLGGDEDKMHQNEKEKNHD